MKSLRNLIGAMFTAGLAFGLGAEAFAQNVGIGTATPQARLDVAGDVRVQTLAPAATSPGIVVQGGNNILQTMQGSAANQTLVYNGTNWTVAPVPAGVVLTDGNIVVGDGTAANVIRLGNGANDGDGLFWDPVAGAWQRRVLATDLSIDGVGSPTNPFRVAQQGATNGQVLTWDNALGRWVPGAAAGTVNTLGPVQGDGSVANPVTLNNGVAVGDVLIWDGAAWQIVNLQTTPRLAGNGSAANPFDIAQQGAALNDVLTWDGTSWVPQANASTVNTLGPVQGDGSVANPVTLNNGVAVGDVLIWDGAAWQIVNLATDATIAGNGSAASPFGIAQQGAALNDVLTWNGTSWVPGPSAGTVNTLGPVQGDGSAANPITLNNGVAVGDVLIWDGAAWQIANLQTTPRLAGNGSAANPFDIAQQGAALNDVLTWDGTSWVPQANASTVITQGPIVGDGSAANPVALQDGVADEDILVWDAGTNTWVVQQFIGWKVDGNNGTNPVANFLGTLDNQGLSIRTNNTEAIRVTETQQVGIGTSLPAAGRLLHVESIGGQLFSATVNAPANNFAASQFTTVFNGIALPANGVINGQTVTTTATPTGTDRYGVRSIFGDATADALYVAGVSGRARYTGSNAIVVPAPGDSIPSIFGVQGQALITNPASSSISTGVYGLSDNVQIGSNIGVAGAAINAGRLTIGTMGAANFGNAQLADQYATLSGSFTDFSAGVYAINRLSGNQDYAVYADGPAPSYFNNNIGVGVLVPTERIHTDGTARLEGMTPQVNGSFVVVSDANGVLNTIQGSAAGGELLQYNAGVWEAVAVPGITPPVTAAPVQGDGTAGSPITLNNGAAVGDVLIWDGAAWQIANLATDATIAGNGSAAAPFGIAQQGAVANDVLTWDGTAWVPQANASTVITQGPIVGDGSAATPVALQDGTTDEDLLVWDAGTNTWVVQQFVGWKVDGNNGTNPTNNFLGTLDNQGLSIRTNNTEAIRVTETQQVGIGTSVPAAGRILHVESIGGQLFNVVSNAPAGGFIATDLETQFSGINVAPNQAINGLKVNTITDQANQAASNRFGVRSIWSEGRSEGLYTAGIYTLANYYGNNTIVVPAPGDSIPVALGMQGHATVANPTASVIGIGGYGLADNIQIGVNVGLAGAATNAAKLNLGVVATANFNNRQLADQYTALSGLYTDFSAGSYVHNRLNGNEDFALFVDGPAPSYFNSNTGIGVFNPTERIHTDGTARLAGMAPQPNGSFVVIADASGVLNTIQGSAAGGELLQYNAGVWEAVAIPGITPPVTAGPVQGDGTAGDPITLNNGAAVGDVLIWDGAAWQIANLATDATISGNGSVATPFGIAQQGAVANDVLTWDGAAWVPQANASTVITQGPIVGDGSAATPVALQDGTTDEDLLVWDAGTSTWVIQQFTGWKVDGNNGTNPTNNFLGTIDNQGLSIRTNSTEAIRVTETQQVGIGTSAPAAGRILHVESTGGQFFNVTANAPANNFAASQFSTQFTGIALPANGVIDGQVVATTAAPTGTNRYGVRSLFADASADALYTAGLFARSRYTGANTIIVPAPGDSIPVAFGVQGQAIITNPNAALIATGIYGLSDNLQTGTNVGVAGAAINAGRITIGTLGAANYGNRQLADQYSSVAASFTDFSAGVYAVNRLSGNQDFAIFADGPAPSYFNANVGVGVQAPTERIHTDGTARLAGMANQPNGASIVIADASGVLNTIQGSAAGGEVLQYNAGVWEAVAIPGLTPPITAGPVVGDGTAGAPITLADGTTDEDLLVWDAGTSSWVIQQFTGWKLDGNAGTNPAANFLGTTDNQGLSVRTNNVEAIRITETQQVGIGTAAPAAGRILHVVSTGGQQYNVNSNAPTNGFIANDFNTQFSGISLPANGDINGVRILTQSNGVAASERYGVRGIWSEAFSDGVYTAAAYLRAVYRGSNTTVIPAANDTIPVVIGSQGHSQLTSAATAVNAAGVYGLSDSPQNGSNYGVVGAASNGNKFNFGVFGAAKATNRVLADVYNNLAVKYASLTASVFAFNNGNTANDYAVFTEGATKSAFGGNVGIGVLNPTERLHTDGTARLAGMAAQPNGNFIVISDASGVLNTIQGTATGGEVLQYNAGVWEAVLLPGTAPLVTGNVIVGDGTAGDPIRVVDGSAVNETLVWDGSAWTIAELPTWRLGGNSIAGPAEYLGTSNNQGLSIRTNATEAMYISETQLVGIGNSAPQRKLHVSGNSGIESEVDFNAPSNGFIANDFNADLTGITLGIGSDVNGTHFRTNASGAAAGQWGVRSVWSEATGNAIYTAGIYTSGLYNGTNVATVAGPGTIIPSVFGIQGQAATSSGAISANAVGVYGLSDSPQLGNNVGVSGLAFGGGNITIGMSAAANLNQNSYAAKLSLISTQTARFTAGVYALNSDNGANDFALYAEGAQSRVTGDLEIGVALPTDAHNTTLHVEGSVSGAVRSIAAAYVATVKDYIILANVSSNYAITLPPVTAQNNGMILHIKRTDVTANVLTLNASAGNNIETTGNTSASITAGLGSVILVANNGTWFIISNN